MRPRMASARPMVTRACRHDPYGAALESVAAEFALLAQRRARTARHLDLLGLQLRAAQASLDAVQTRMTALAWRMDSIDPTLRPVGALEPALPQPPFAPSSQRLKAQPPPTSRGNAAMFYSTQLQPSPAHVAPTHVVAAHVEPPAVQPFKAKRPMMVLRAKRQMPRRRPFSPE